MGKPFESEIKALPGTYEWAMSLPIDRLSRAVEKLLGHPLLAVGSGGSFSACHFAAHLHGLLAGQPAVPMTPLQAVDHRTPIADMGVLLPTAGGNNPDVVAAVRILAEQEPRSMLVLCGNAESRVASQASRFGFVDFVPFELPAGKDGFLATNSLLAFCVLLCRAYHEASGQKAKLPKTFQGLLTERRLASNRALAGRRYEQLLEKRTLLVLHGPSTTAAAVDIESKFTEAALGHVQISDFRQFAHGRHHWLAKKENDTAILSLESPEDADVATQTLALLPTRIPTKRLTITHRFWLADLAAICEGIFLADAAGIQRGIDPGRPGVPSFGRKLYHANAFRAKKDANSMAKWKVRAIERKSGEKIERLAAENRLSFWSEALDSVLDDLQATRFGGIVLDYDGTLCSEDQRFDPLPEVMARSLTSLLESGASIGIATGRGKSVRKNLRDAIAKRYWPQITVGYYNGSQIIPLQSSDIPDGAEQVENSLLPILDAILADGVLAQGGITRRLHQITLTPPRGLSLDALFEHAVALLNRISPSGLRVMRSGHSIDIVPAEVSKLAVVESLSTSKGAKEILRIGDRGRWPGNDAQLLASPYGLSVHETSSDAKSCWNIAPPGFRGWQATLHILKRLAVSKQGIRMRASLSEEA